ncbi:hypothetical protein Mapa_012614 [Marchantia paleacea]|nr:hypothetical protein Mapa_012614 [Marchantia paleacea]
MYDDRQYMKKLGAKKVSRSVEFHVMYTSSFRRLVFRMFIQRMQKADAALLKQGKMKIQDVCPQGNTLSLFPAMHIHNERNPSTESIPCKEPEADRFSRAPLKWDSVLLHAAQHLCFPRMPFHDFAVDWNQSRSEATTSREIRLVKGTASRSLPFCLTPLLRI